MPPPAIDLFAARPLIAPRGCASPGPFEALVARCMDRRVQARWRP